jgi:hypothetical protein
LTQLRGLGPRPQIDFLGESTEGNLQLVDSLRKGHSSVINVFGMHRLDDIIKLPLAKLKAATQVGVACTRRLRTATIRTSSPNQGPL